MSDRPAIRIQGLHVVRGRQSILRNLDLEITSGAVTGLLGPSGSGKTTLMRAIVGVQRLAAGTVEVLGQPAGSAALRSQVGYVTQAPATYADLTVRENLEYFARIVDAPRHAVPDAIARVGLTGMEQRIVGTLSGGQRARVSLATALLNTPAMLVLDEPTVGLDPVLRRSLWQMFHELAAGGTTLLVSSHVMDEATRCDALVLMRDGRVIAADAPQALLARTHTADMEAAFLALIGNDRSAA